VYRSVLLSNLAECHIRMGDFNKALNYARESLVLDGTNAKTLFRLEKTETPLRVAAYQVHTDPPPARWGSSPSCE